MKILMVNKFLYPRGGSESYMLSLGIDGFTQSGKAAKESFIPDFDVFEAI